MRKFAITFLSLILTLSLFGQIKNPDKPLKGKWDFQMKKMWEAEKAEEYFIARIQNFGAAKDGRVYILDPKNFKIYIFSKEGKFISAFGEKGEGPGEIKKLNVGKQLFVIDDQVLVVDLGRIHSFTLEGAYKKSFVYPAQLRPKTIVSGDILIAAPSIVYNPQYKMVLYNISNKSQKTVLDYSIYEKIIDNEGKQHYRTIVADGITPMMYISSGNGQFYYGMNAVYEITIADKTGKKISSFSVEGRKKKKVSQRFKDALRKRFAKFPEDVVKKVFNELPDEVCYFDDIIIDSKGMVYVLQAEPHSSNSRALDIFSPGGKFLYSAGIKVEEGFSIRNIYLNDELLLMALQDEEGNLKAVKYIVKQPSL